MLRNVGHGCGDHPEARIRREEEMTVGWAGRQRRTGIVVALAVAALLAIGVLVWFQPQKLLIDERVDEHLDLYFAQCSVLVSARDLAVMGATLANHGVNPITGERAIDRPGPAGLLGQRRRARVVRESHPARGNARGPG